MRYDSYKESGIEWIGEIPEHWKVIKNKYVFKSKRNLVEDSSKTQLLSLTTNGIREKDKEDIGGKMPESYDNYQIVKQDDIVFCLFDLDCSAVFSDVSKYEGMISPAYDVYYFHDKLNPKFYKYLYDYCFIQRSYKMYSKSLRFTITNDNFNSLLTIVPTYKEQELIVKYLDDKTKKIDTIIKSLETQIEKLEMYKRELIAEVVTKGLDKNASMKDSGVDWIGQVPEHWEIHPLFSIFKQNKVKNIGMKNNNLLSLSYGNIIRKDIDTTFGLLPANFENYQIVDKGYIILRLTDLQNDKKSLRTGLVRENGIITSAYIGLEKILSKSNNDYMHYLLHSYDLMKVFYSMGSGLRQSLNFDDIKRLPIVLPKDEEQNEIVKHLDSRVNKVERIKNKLQLQIEKLKIYRKIVIHDAVTGKVKVSGGEF